MPVISGIDRRWQAALVEAARPRGTDSVALADFFDATVAALREQRGSDAVLELVRGTIRAGSGRQRWSTSAGASGQR